MNEIKISSYSKPQKLKYFASFLGKDISSSDCVDKKKKSDACNFQSDLDLHYAKGHNVELSSPRVKTS